MIINGSAFNLHQRLNRTNDKLQTSMGKLSSGKRITSASVDAAGLAISEKLRALQRGSRQALLNVQNAQSLVQTADSAMQEMTEVVQRIRELTIQAMNGTNTDVTTRSATEVDTLLIQNEIDELKKNLRDIVHNTEFNTKKLLTNDEPGNYVVENRSVAKDVNYQTGHSLGAIIMTGNTVGQKTYDPIRVPSTFKTETLSYSILPSSTSPISVNMSTVVDHMPRWTNDGSSILFTSSRDGQQYIVDAGGGADPSVAAGETSAPVQTAKGDYRLTYMSSLLYLQKWEGGSWNTKASYSYNASNGSNGFSFSPGLDPLGNTSFVFADGQGNISKVDLNVLTGQIGSETPLIPTTDVLNLPPQNNTLALSFTPDLYRMNDSDASLVVRKVTDNGSKTLVYWDGSGTPPGSGYYTVSGNQVSFFDEAIIGMESDDDAQDYYSFQYVQGAGENFYTRSIPSYAQIYNMHGQDGPMSLRITVGGRVVQRSDLLAVRPADSEYTNGVFVDQTSGKVELYGSFRPASNETVTIYSIADSDNDKGIQTHSLPQAIDTYNLNSNDPNLPRSLHVYVGGKRIEFDETKTNGYYYDSATRRISIYGDSRPDVFLGEQIQLKYIADASQTSTEVYGISLGGLRPEIYNLGDVDKPNSIRVFRGAEEIAYSSSEGYQYNSATNTIELYGDSRPNIDDVYSIRMVLVTDDTIRTDDKIELVLSSNAELYGLADPDIPDTIKVTVDNKEIPYDPNKLNGYFYNSSTQRIEIYGDSRPDANHSTYSSIQVHYVSESSASLVSNNSYDMQMPAGTSDYGIDGQGSVKGLKILYRGVEVPYDPMDGFTYDPNTRLLSLHGSYRPTSQDSANDYRVFSVPQNSLSVGVPNDSTIHKVLLNGKEILEAENDDGHGYIFEGGHVRLVGDARPDVATSNTSYQLSVQYTAPVFLNLAVSPLITGTSSYCEHETGSALPDAEWVADSLVVSLNNAELSADQYEVTGNRIALVKDAVTLIPGMNRLSADYQVRQGAGYKENSFTFQVGGNTGDHKSLEIAAFDNMLQGMSAVCVRHYEHAEQGLQIIDDSMSFILRELGNIGAAENSLSHIAANLASGEEQLTASLSRIEDVDIAKEIMNATRLQILAQAQQALAGQAKQTQESVLKLLT